MVAINENLASLLTYAQVAPAGTDIIPLDIDIDADYQSEANDRLNLLALPEGRTLLALILVSNEAGDSHATPTLDADLVLVQGVDNPTDTGTETVLYNAGTRWQAASTTLVVQWVNTKLTEEGYNGLAYLRWKAVTASATAVDGFNIKLLVVVR